MIACVGQQAISGKRIPDGFEDRALPYFPRKCNDKLLSLYNITYIIAIAHSVGRKASIAAAIII